MKFNTTLNEAVLIRRILNFMAEVNLSNKKKLLISCPNMGDLKGCDVLGSRIWYSNAIGFDDLHTWELAEVDEGHMVCINNEHMTDLVIEGITYGTVRELQDYSLLQTNAPALQGGDSIDILLEEGTEQCYVMLESIFATNDKLEGIFPDNLDVALYKINQLLQLRQAGHRAVLFFCVQHTGIDVVKISDPSNREFAALLSQALQAGIEILAYKASITTQGISLEHRLPIRISEKISQ